MKAEHCKDDDDDDLTDDDRKPDGMLGHTNIPHHPPYHHHHAMLGGYPGIKEELSGSKNPPSSDCGVPIPATKPKIWSLADTAACKTPPPLQAHHLHQQHAPAAWMSGGYHPHNPHSTSAEMMMASGGHTGMNMSGVGMNTLNHTQQNMAMSSGMMDNFANSQYSRYGGFLGGSHHYNTNNNNNHITNMPVPGPHKQHPNTPITPTHLQQQNSNGSSTNSSTQHSPQQQQHQQLDQQQQQHLQHQQQQSMGFPEVQTDTPPQTPPNLKLPSVAGTLLTQTPTTGTCYNTNNQPNNINNNNTSTTNNNLNRSNGYSSSSPPGSNNYVGNFTRMQQHSPQKAQEYSQHMMASPQQDTAAFKPFYKR